MIGWSVFESSSWASGVGGAALGLLTGHFRAHHGRIAKLEKEVQECRKRDADFHIVKAGFRLLVGAMTRNLPDSIELKMCADMLAKSFGGPIDVEDFTDILKEVDIASPEEWDGPRREWKDEGNE